MLFIKTLIKVMTMYVTSAHQFDSNCHEFTKLNPQKYIIQDMKGVGGI